MTENIVKRIARDPTGIAEEEKRFEDCARTEQYMRGEGAGLAVLAWIVAIPTGLLVIGLVVAAATYLAARPSPVAPVPMAEAVYVASRDREPFHALDCRWAARIGRAKVGYRTKADAVADGHRACKVCRP